MHRESRYTNRLFRPRLEAVTSDSGEDGEKIIDGIGSLSIELSKVVSVAFKEALSETSLKSLLNKVTLQENDKLLYKHIIMEKTFDSNSNFHVK